MIKNKNKFFLICFMILILSFKSVAFALDDNADTSKYVDYSYEFIGHDKWESINRKVFVFNMKFNKYFVRPINVVWASIVPQYGMDRIQSFYKNLNYPMRAVSCLCQKDFSAAGTETLRFFTNTTLGIVGLYDPAYTRFKLEPKDEDMRQVLAHYNIRLHHYFVLPLVVQGNARDILGQILNLPLNPTSYFFAGGSLSMVSGGVSVLNDTTVMQPLYKMADNYADPYETTKQLYGIERYIKNNNLDRSEIFKNLTANDNTVLVSNMEQLPKTLNADVTLEDYNSQGPLVDTMRTLLFDNQNLNKSKWSELSVWNKSFPNQLKTSSVKIIPNRAKYKYRYILQKNKNSPVAIIYPSIGENFKSQESVIQAKLLYDQGYSVIIMGSAFQWAFVKSMPKDYAPGLPTQDAYYLRITTSLILNQLQGKYACKFKEKILVGTSFGALTGLFVAADEGKNNLLGISKYIFICPPIDTFFALKQIDKYSQNWLANSDDIQLKTAITTKKVLNISQKVATNVQTTQTLPLTQSQAELAIGYSMKQKLSDVIFTLENGSISKKNNDLHNYITHMNFYDYADKYLISRQQKPLEQLIFESSLYSISDYLQKNSNYKIYHSLNDCFASENQLIWLKNQTENKSIFFSDGSHLGFLYRREFINNFIKDINGNPNKL